MRFLLSPDYSHPAHAPGAEWTAAKWASFWRTPLPHSTHGVLFRFLLGKLTNRSLLHRIVPLLIPSAKCIICRYCDESSLTSSSPARSSSVFGDWLGSNTLSPHSAASSQSSPPSPPGIGLRYVRAPHLCRPSLSSAPSSLPFRSAHWRHIFDEVPFTAINAVATVNKTTQYLHDEARLLPHSSP
ncbi:hypothetical protein DM01DRAFT_328846 [Hesseltinella vesiculosa]|uniref:Uncharacterized protein n=1 Tax=Hesseltinella vesiculosa TaxID=101127 RepID=A0A1X2GJR5_9FUNG|nr:hypothetical protein DM01DRAFT_328846 [Hesseltinella vesiculosa]